MLPELQTIYGVGFTEILGPLIPPAPGAPGSLSKSDPFTNYLK